MQTFKFQKCMVQERLHICKLFEEKVENIKRNG